uniref:Uncharacterized protein n=1 Tax=Schistosoma mansoni TaxID=6183 RepID=A0AA82N7Z0_SCHMA
MKILFILFIIIIIIYYNHTLIDGSGSFPNRTLINTTNTESTESSLKSQLPEAQPTSLMKQSHFSSAYKFFRTWFVFLMPQICKLVTILSEFIK